MEKEKIILATIYKQDDKYYTEFNEMDTPVFELYGYLTIYLKDLEESLRMKQE